ncbi:hypothetical protein MIND_01301400 [Mycena indigotica]|uniref:Uncharacterized protein n=1 Tax=Mycena indigotica TaxID=2126181 RepID=A0A8H6VQT1_9AGAR|nr:uncharacterized protein MIND_01301400 [Mycena indigotica]KAF7290612.1 hypothetical protein MIND_01301400 [Mycena indigotica]
MSQSENYVFKLSKKSTTDRRNMFLFSVDPDNYSVYMFGGWNLDRHPRMTIRTFYRWLDLILARRAFPEGPYDFELRVFQVQERYPLHYGLNDRAALGPAIARDAEGAMPPGVYAAFYPGSDKVYWFGAKADMRAVRSLQDILENKYGKLSREQIEALATEYMHISAPIAEQVKQRDNNRCFFTGRTDVLTVQVIVIPANQVTGESVDNVITISSELVDAFRRNALSVDYDNEAYRTVVFAVLSPDPEVNARLISLVQSNTVCTPATAPALAAEFLRHHFMWTLRVHFEGGDIRGDYSETIIDELMVELAEDGDFSDERWKAGEGIERDIGDEVVRLWKRIYPRWTAPSRVVFPVDPEPVRPERYRHTRRAQQV